MANYKGVGFDTTGKLRTGTNADAIQFAAEVQAQDGIAVTGNASVSGNLNVTGDIVSGGATNIVIKDPAIDLGVGTETAQSTGFSFVANKGSQENVINTITASSRTVNCTAATNIAANDIVQISGASDSANDGLYVVASVSTPNIVLGNTAYVGTLPFIQTAFNGDSTGGKITRVDLKAVIVAGEGLVATGGGGNFPEGTLLEKFAADAKLSDFNSAGSYTEIGGGTTDLQSAYNAGASITTSGNTDIAFALNAGNFTVNSGSFLVGNTSVVTAFNVDSSAFSIDGAGASNVTATGANLTLSTATSGNVVLSGAGTVQVAAGALDIDTSVDFDGSTFAADATGAITLTSSQNSVSAIVFNTSAANGDVRFKSQGNDVVQIDGAGMGVTGDLDASGNLGIFGNTTLGNANTDTVTFTARIASNVEPSQTNVRNLGSASLLWANVYSTVFDGGSLALSSTATVAGLANLNGGIAVDSTKFTVDGGGTGNVSTEGTLNVDSTSTFGNTITLDQNGAQSITKAAGSNGQDFIIGLTGATDSSVKIQSAGTGNDAIALTASAGDIAIDAEGAGKSAIVIADFPQIARNINAGSGGVAEKKVGKLLNESGNARVLAAQANSISNCYGVGVILQTANAGNNTTVAFYGIATIVSDDSFATSDIGKPVYLSAANAGNVTRSAPTAAGQVVYQVGICVDGNSNDWNILIQPQFILENG